MKIYQNEQEVKKPVKQQFEITFLKIEGKNELVLKSHLIMLETSYDPATKKTILYSERTGLPKRRNFYYFGILDKKEGVIRLPPSVFFTMNEAESLTGQDKRHFLWAISKKGEGLDTRYYAFQKQQVAVNDEEIKKNTEKLKKVLEAVEKKFAENLRNYLSQKGGENDEFNPE